MADRDDLPASDPDLAFDTLADRLAAVLQRDRSAAFVLGLHGPWGSGKTSLLLAVRKRLPANAIVIDFNAWKYQDKEALSARVPKKKNPRTWRTGSNGSPRSLNGRRPSARCSRSFRSNSSWTSSAR